MRSEQPEPLRARTKRQSSSSILAGIEDLISVPLRIRSPLLQIRTESFQRTPPHTPGAAHARRRSNAHPPLPRARPHGVRRGLRGAQLEKRPESTSPGQGQLVAAPHGRVPSGNPKYDMTSQPGTSALASATGSSCYSQTSPNEDHTYVTQDTPPARSTLGKRRGGEGDNSSSTPAKQLAAESDPMEQELIEGDLEGFVLVEHRRQRTTGIPVLFVPANEGHRLQNQNPLSLSAEVNAEAAAAIIRHRFTARGGLLVEVAETATVDRLLKVRCLGGVPVQATVPRTYLQNCGIIRGVPLWHTDGELATFMQQDGVIAARRLYRRRGKPGEAAQPTDKAVLTFRPSTERPCRISLGFTKHEVSEYIEAPTRCFKCQVLGHVAKYCKGDAKSKKCAQPHLTRDCPGETAVKCANCGGDHPADYVNCKVRLRALARTKQFVHGPKRTSPSNENTIPKSATFSATDTADAQETPSVAEQGAKPKGPSQKTKKKTRASTTIPPTPNQGPPRKLATSSEELKATDVSSRTANRRTYSDVVSADQRLSVSQPRAPLWMRNTKNFERFVDGKSVALDEPN
ncbi:hypothetical protein HPB47_012100 [Ixodes persulcatus]|uniref:Uncharacterized protein n=1 Tax=Ixodes persulcatus TaxID=34615 RepID=A0AC60NUJ9_IXOPE|nr:hypothetical protein HPB47_012100 [Ixodes persulcatus]